jgi:hypothetical protein
MAGREHGFVAGHERAAGSRREVLPAGGACLLDGHLHLQQQLLEVFGPRLVVLLLQKGELTQMMDIAQRVAAASEGPIAGPAVVHAPPGKGRQNTNRLSGLAAPLGVHGVVGEPRCARHMRPGQGPRAAHARFITVQHRHPCERLLDLRLHQR